MNLQFLALLSHEIVAEVQNESVTHCVSGRSSTAANICCIIVVSYKLLVKN